MRKTILILVTGMISLALTGTALAIDLPDPGTTYGLTPAAVQYGDFYSYSLPILAYYYDKFNGGGVGPSNPFYVESSPGQIENDIVIATGTSSNPATTNIAGVEDAYGTPSGSKPGEVFNFSTRNYPNPGQVAPFTGQQTGTWDAQVSTLRNYTDDLVFFFNNNQENSGGSENQRLYAWGQIELIDNAGVLPNLYFDFTNTWTANDVTLYNSPGLATSEYPYPELPPVGTWPNTTDFVLSGGQIWLDEATGEVYFGTNPPANFTKFINHNLGANQAAYAVFSPELNAIIQNPNSGYDVMRGDFRMTLMNNGYEQLFIRPSTVEQPPVIPEPATLLLLGLGLTGLALKRSKK